MDAETSGRFRKNQSSRASQPHANRNSVLQVRNVSKSFPGVRALDNVSLDVAAGSVHALMGENGAGKSTLMRIVSGLDTADTGEIRCSGRVAMIHQELMPFRDLTVAENIFMGQEPTRRFGWLDKPAMHRESQRLLDHLGMTLSPSRPMRELSVAQMQTVEIAKALARRAELLIMDEPTSAISEHEVEALFKIIRDLKQRGVAIIYISHKMDEIFRIADTVTVLRDGRHVATHPIGELDEAKLIALMVGRELSPGGPRSVEAAGDVALEVRHLTKPGRFRDINFTLRHGEVLGLAGLMGAVRTDVANAIFGMFPADSGEIRVHDQPSRIASPRDAIALGIGMVSEDRREFGLVPTMSVKHNLTLASLRGWLLDHRAENTVADEQIRAFGIKTPGRNQSVTTLSGGNQQKVVLAKTLLSEPAILILDEPTRGIDIGAKTEMHAFVRQLARDGKAVLLISSELPELLALSDRLLVMREGVLTAELDPRRATQEEILQHAMPDSGE